VKVWTGAETRRMRHMIEVERLPAADVATALGRSLASVRSKAQATACSFTASRQPYVARRHRDGGFPRIDCALLVSLYRAGARVRDIANHFGCSPQTIRERLRMLDEPRRPVGRPKRRSGAIPWPRREWQPPTREVRT
jgi:hypothetical protein